MYNSLNGILAARKRSGQGGRQVLRLPSADFYIFCNLTDVFSRGIDIVTACTEILCCSNACKPRNSVKPDTLISGSISIGICSILFITLRVRVSFHGMICGNISAQKPCDICSRRKFIQGVFYARLQAFPNYMRFSGDKKRRSHRDVCPAVSFLNFERPVRIIRRRTGTPLRRMWQNCN